MRLGRRVVHQVHHAEAAVDGSPVGGIGVNTTGNSGYGGFTVQQRGGGAIGVWNQCNQYAKEYDTMARPPVTHAMRWWAEDGLRFALSNALRTRPPHLLRHLDAVRDIPSFLCEMLLMRLACASFSRCPVAPARSVGHGFLRFFWFSLSSARW